MMIQVASRPRLVARLKIFVVLLACLPCAAFGCSCSHDNTPQPIADAAREEPAQQERRDEELAADAASTDSADAAQNGAGEGTATEPASQQSSAQPAESGPDDAALAPTGSAHSGGSVKTTPEQALQSARLHIVEADRAAQDGDFATAFKSSLAAWQQVRQHPANAECQAIAGRLEHAMRQYGETVNANGLPPKRKPLRVE